MIVKGFPKSVAFAFNKFLKTYHLEDKKGIIYNKFIQFQMNNENIIKIFNFNNLNEVTTNILEIEDTNANIKVVDNVLVLDNIVSESLDSETEILGIMIDLVLSESEISNLEVNQTYNISFTSSSSIEDRPIKIIFGYIENDNFVILSQEEKTLTKNNKVYSSQFTLTTKEDNMIIRFII